MASLRVLGLRRDGIGATRRGLREKARMFRTLLSNLDGMAYRCRNDGQRTMEFVSEGCGQLTGYAPSEMLLNQRISYEEITSAQDRARVREEIRTALAWHRRFFVEYRVQCRDGAVKWVGERGVGITDDHGAVVSCPTAC